MAFIGRRGGLEPGGRVLFRFLGRGDPGPPPSAASRRRAHAACHRLTPGGADGDGGSSGRWRRRRLPGEPVLLQPAGPDHDGSGAAGSKRGVRTDSIEGVKRMRPIRSASWRVRPRPAGADGACGRAAGAAAHTSAGGCRGHCRLVARPRTRRCWLSLSKTGCRTAGDCPHAERSRPHWDAVRAGCGKGDVLLFLYGPRTIRAGQRPTPRTSPGTAPPGGTCASGCSTTGRDRVPAP